MTTDWIKVTDRKPAQSGYYMTVQRDTVSGKPFRGMTNFIKGYGWSTLHATVTHWLEMPELLKAKKPVGEPTVSFRKVGK